MEKRNRRSSLPIDAFGRLYHIGLRYGEASNKIILVGEERRAKLISNNLSNIITIKSERGFTTFIGSYNEVKITVMSIGMGMAMMDFALRELRSIIDGAMAVIRLGTCGVIRTSVENPLGTISICELGTAIIQRNFDLDSDSSRSYRVSQVWMPDPQLTSEMKSQLEGFTVLPSLNVTTDSFYSSQGRISLDFSDQNEGLLDEIMNSFPQAPNISMEMETGMLIYAAQKQIDQNKKIHATAIHIVVADRAGIEETFLTSADIREGIESKLAIPILNTISSFNVNKDK